jgi:putative ABC transport system permease protein
MLKDLLFTLRTLRRQPTFTLAAVATLALGMGATIAIFSTVNAALLRPLPYPHVEDLRIVGTAMTDGRPTTGKVAPMELARLNDPTLSIAQIAVATPTFEGTVIGRDGNPMPIVTAGAGEGFFDLFGLPMTLGRAFTHDEHVLIAGPGGPGGPGGPRPSVVISYRLWRNLFGGDPGVVGQTLNVLEFNGNLPIVGVAPRAFDTPPGTDVWYNQRLDLPAAATGSTPGSQGHNFDGYVRLKPGTRPERLQSELTGVMGRLAREFPFIDNYRIYTARTLVAAIVGDLGSTLVIVLCASALLLLLACVNVTNLLLARGAVRAREMALRVALGASRGRIVRQLLTESLVLAAAGATAGLALAFVGVRLLLALGASTLPRLDSVPFDRSVLLFALVVTLASAVLVGLVPALRLAATDIRTLMNDSGRSATGGRAQHRILATMVVSEIALAIMLVAGAGWLVRSFANQQRTDPGFSADGRLAVRVLVPFAKYSGPDKVAVWSREVADRLHAIGGVTAVGSTSTFPLIRGRETLINVTYLAFQEQLNDPDHPRPVHAMSVSPEFFDAMGIKLIGGRAFTADDRRDTTPVAIVNRSFLRRYLTGRDPLKERFAVGYPNIDPKTMMTIVGIVDDVKYGSLAEVTEPIYYTPQAQAPYWQQAIVVATSLGDPTSVASSVRAAIKSVDPQLLVRVDAVPQIVSSSLRAERLSMTLMIVFACAALGLAAIGIYGVIAYASAQREGEVATRMALGATPAHVFWLMMHQGRTLALVGTALGVAAALAAGRIVASQLYQVRASDPLILASTVVLVAAITALAVAVPARRASRLSPARVLRLG